MGEITEVSNEIELNLHNILAPFVVDYGLAKGLRVSPEVNLWRVVELEVSRAADVYELNSRLRSDVETLSSIVTQHGGQLYGGGLVLEQNQGIHPAWYRSTSLSRSFAQELKGISGQQTVIGVQGEELAINLCNYFQRLGPLLQAVSASSPLRMDRGQVITNEHDQVVLSDGLSERVFSYQRGAIHLPKRMLEAEELQSFDHYTEVLQSISDEVNRSLTAGLLDSNVEELYKNHERIAYAPFDCLEPHQIFWSTRFRPDHRNELSDCSIEVRAMDTPITLSAMCAINELVMGVAYFAASQGVSQLPALPSASVASTQEVSRTICADPTIYATKLAEVYECAQQGLVTQFGNRSKPLYKFVQPLEYHGPEGLAIYKGRAGSTVEHIRSYLVDRLLQ